MTFLSTWAFVFLGLVPVIVLLYLLKIKRRAAAVSTLMFWERVLVENRRRALFHRLRQLFSLLLHLLIFLLILLALARPELSRLAHGGASTVLVLDTRARMQAAEADGETRFEKARRVLAACARRAGSGNPVALLTAGATAEVAAPFCDDEKTLTEVIAKLQPTDAAGGLDAALLLADKLLASRAGEKNIVLLTDRPLEKPPHLAAKIECIALGQPHDNVAITRFAARPLLNSPQTSEVLLELRNLGAKPVRGNAEIFFDENLIDVKPFDLAPGARRVETFSFVPHTAPKSRGWLRARFDVGDSLALDNEAFAVLPAQKQKRVLLVTRGNWFLEKLLESDERTKWELLTPDAFRPAMAAGFDAVILDNALPANFDLEKTAGNFLFIKQTPWTKGGALDQPIASETDARSPLLRLVVLENVTFLRAARLDIPASPVGWHFDAPLRAPEQPLIITGERPGGGGKLQRVAAFAFDVAETDLPLRVAFPLLMANTLGWLAGENVEPAPSARTGETIMLGADETIQSEPRKNMSDAPEAASPQVRGVFRPEKNGWYLRENSSRKTWLAVNTFSESESDLRFASASSSAGELARGARFSVAALIAWPFWFYLALTAFALFALEWRLFHQRHTE